MVKFFEREINSNIKIIILLNTEIEEQQEQEWLQESIESTSMGQTEIMKKRTKRKDYMTEDCKSTWQKNNRGDQARNYCAPTERQGTPSASLPADRGVLWKGQ